jgi:hypothetical protein
MVANEEILRLNQAGFESTRGTGVAATRKVYANISPNFTKALRDFSDTSGTFEDRRRLAFQREIITFSGVELLTYEDLAWWAQLMLKGNVAGVGDAGTPEAFTYTFVPSLATDDLEAMTLEWNHVGNAYESTQVMVNTWAIRIDPDNEGGWMLDLEMLARDMATTTHTAAIPDRTTEVIKAPTTKLYLDDATLGSTQVTDKFISATVNGNNNIHFKAFAEHETQFAANKVGRGARRHSATVTMEFDSDAEFAKMRAGTKRYMRILTEGAVIHDAVKSQAQIDMNGYWETIAWANREGNIIATFGLAGFYDVTSGYSLKLTVVNDIETLD